MKELIKRSIFYQRFDSLPSADIKYDGTQESFSKIIDNLKTNIEIKKRFKDPLFFKILPYLSSVYMELLLDQTYALIIRHKSDSLTIVIDTGEVDADSNPNKEFVAILDIDSVKTEMLESSSTPYRNIGLFGLFIASISLAVWYTDFLTNIKK